MTQLHVRLAFLAPLLLVGCSDMFGETRPTPQQQGQQGLQQPSSEGALAAAEPAVPKEEEPWVCKGHPSEPTAPQVQSGAAPGRVEIKCEAEGAAPQPQAGPGPAVVKHEDPLVRKCRFVAQEATLSQVSVALAEATGVGVLVHPAFTQAHVSLVMPGATLRQFLDAVRTEGVHVRWSAQENAVRLGFTEEAREDRGEPRRERMLTLGAKVPMKQFGQAICSLLTPRGHLEIVGHHLFVTDVPDVLNRATLLARGLDEENPPTPVQWNSVYDAYAKAGMSYETAAHARRLIEDALSTSDDQARRDKLQQVDQLLSSVKPPEAKLTAPAPTVPPAALPHATPAAPSPADAMPLE